MTDACYPLVYNEALQADYFKLGLRTQWKSFSSGQFVMLEVPREEGVLLRRPFSLSSQNGDITEILYKVVGKGTKALSRLRAPISIRVLGPLGNGFVEPKEDLVAVAGGYGIAPFIRLAQMIKAKGKKLHLFYGAKESKDIINIQSLKSANIKLYIATEDGSLGYPGLVVDLLDKHIQDIPHSRVLACGPTGMLKAVQSWCAKHKLACELSVEERMGCGTGVCLGCVVKTFSPVGANSCSQSERFVCSCQEGPVFSGDKIIL